MKCFTVIIKAKNKISKEDRGGELTGHSFFPSRSEVSMQVEQNRCIHAITATVFLIIHKLIVQVRSELRRLTARVTFWYFSENTGTLFLMTYFLSLFLAEKC